MSLFQSRHSSDIQLSSEDMLAIDNQIRRDYRSNYSSRLAGKQPQFRLSAQDMLSISEEIRRDYSVHKLYHPIHTTSEIVLLPVDPSHLHAYWHLDNKQHRHEYDHSLTLRVHGVPEATVMDHAAHNWFDLSVQHDRSQLQLTVPESIRSNHFWAELGWARDDTRFEALVCSEKVFVPRTPEMIRDILAERLTINTASGLGRMSA